MNTVLSNPALIPTVIRSIPSPPLTWLGLATLSYHVPGEPQANIRTYELVYRPQKGTASPPESHPGKHVDANDVIAITTSKLRPELNQCLVIVMQYRPAVNAFTLEFPAGLIDPNETDPLFSALRELNEETGLSPTIQHTKLAYTFTYEPGISCGLGNAVTCVVDMDDPINLNPAPDLQEGEWSLRTFILPLIGLHQTLCDFVHNNEHVILDSRLGAYALGLDHASKLLQK